MKLAYNGTTWDWIFSVPCRVFLIQVLDINLKILKDCEIFPLRTGFRSVQVHLRQISLVSYVCTPHYTAGVPL
jgi:hypothetical protein